MNKMTKVRVFKLAERGAPYATAKPLANFDLDTLGMGADEAMVAALKRVRNDYEFRAVRSSSHCPDDSIVIYVTD